jgi:hypothetical protein
VYTIGLKKQIDDLGRKIEQLTDEEKNLRRLIRKKNMRYNTFLDFYFQ